MINLVISLAEEKDIPEIIAFLCRPEIDSAFVYPLSHREIRIEQRVTSKFPNGFWLLARLDGNVIGVRGCKGIIDPQKSIRLSFTSMPARARVSRKDKRWIA